MGVHTALIFAFGFLVALSTAGFVENTTKSCPSYLKDVESKVFGDKCYVYMLKEKKDYLEAKLDCQEKIGKLAMPKNQGMNEEIQKTAADLGYNGNLWIGLSDPKNDGVFVWEDGNPLEGPNCETDHEANMPCTFWAKDNGPGSSWINSYFGNCVVMEVSDRGQWHDHRCQNLILGIIKKEFAYVCELPAVDLGLEIAKMAYGLF